MNHLRLRSGEPGVRQEQLKHLLLTGLTIGFANAVAGPVTKGITEEGLGTLYDGAGVGLVIWTIAGWTLFSLSKADIKDPITQSDFYVCFSVALAFLIPSAMIAWTASAALAFWGFCRCSGCLRAQTALLIFAAMAIRTPVTALSLGTLSEEFLSIDAYLVKIALLPTNIEVLQIGNIIVGEDDHKLAIMTGCSSFTNVSIGLLVWFAITRGSCHTISRRAAIAGICVVAAIIFLNVTRLALMATNADVFAFIHDGYGKDIFELSLIIATLTFTLLGSGGKYATSALRDRRDPVHSV